MDQQKIACIWCTFKLIKKVKYDYKCKKNTKHIFMHTCYNQNAS